MDLTEREWTTIWIALIDHKEMLNKDAKVWNMPGGPMENEIRECDILIQKAFTAKMMKHKATVNTPNNAATANTIRIG